MEILPRDMCVYFPLCIIQKQLDIHSNGIHRERKRVKYFFRINATTMDEVISKVFPSLSTYQIMDNFFLKIFLYVRSKKGKRKYGAEIKSKINHVW